MSVTMQSSQEDAKKEINVVINGDKDSELGKVLTSQENIKSKIMMSLKSFKGWKTSAYNKYSR